MKPDRTENIRPYVVTRALYRVFHRAFLGGSVAERDAAIQEVEEGYRIAFKEKGRLRAEREFVRSMTESVDDDTRFVLKVLFRVAYAIARVVSF